MEQRREENEDPKPKQETVFIYRLWGIQTYISLHKPIRYNTILNFRCQDKMTPRWPLLSVCENNNFSKLTPIFGDRKLKLEAWLEMPGSKF